MSTEAPHPVVEFSRFEQLRFARQVIRQEGDALLALADRLPDEFSDAVGLILHGAGNVIVTGMGKAGLIGQKIAATLASTGTSSHFLHPSEAVHGDLGRIHRHDIVLSTLVQRQDGGTDSPAAVAGVDASSAHCTNWRCAESSGPGGSSDTRIGPSTRGLCFGAGAEHKYDRDARTGRCCGVGRQPCTGI